MQSFIMDACNPNQSFISQGSISCIPLLCMHAVIVHKDIITYIKNKFINKDGFNDTKAFIDTYMVK